MRGELHNQTQLLSPLKDGRAISQPENLATSTSQLERQNASNHVITLQTVYLSERRRPPPGPPVLVAG